MIVAPTVYFSAQLDPATGVVTGYAAPASGPAPCRIHVRSDGRIVAAMDATAYAGDDCPIRLGWCGFSLRLNSELFIFSNDLELLCAVEGKVMLTIALSDVEEFALIRPQPRTTVTIADLLLMSANPISISGFARLLYEIVRHGTAELAVHVAYQTLLCRNPDPSGLYAHIPQMKTLKSISTVVEGIVSSPEFASLSPDRHFQSPYQDRIAPAALEVISNSRTIAMPDGDKSLAIAANAIVDNPRGQLTHTAEFNGDALDAKWYAQYYRDVGLLGLDAATHFEWIGRRLGRAPNAATLKGGMSK